MIKIIDLNMSDNINIQKRIICDGLECCNSLSNDMEKTTKKLYGFFKKVKKCSCLIKCLFCCFSLSYIERKK